MSTYKTPAERAMMQAFQQSQYLSPSKIAKGNLSSLGVDTGYSARVNGTGMRGDAMPDMQLPPNAPPWELKRMEEAWRRSRDRDAEKFEKLFGAGNSDPGQLSSKLSGSHLDDDFAEDPFGRKKF